MRLAAVHAVRTGTSENEHIGVRVVHVGGCNKNSNLMAEWHTGGEEQ
jgi:hypothetical protein